MLNIESENGTPLDNQIEKADHQDETADENVEPFDYTHVHAVARIALYDDLRSAPRVTEIHPAPTAEFIESLASKFMKQAKNAGGPFRTPSSAKYRKTSSTRVSPRLPCPSWTRAIPSVSPTMCPGIPYKDQAQIPGFTSAVEPMKHYIRGVGLGLPIVKEYLDFSHGTITIEDNLGTGAVVTISLRAGEATDMPPVDQSSALHPASAQPSAMEPAYPMHEAPQQLQQQILPSSRCSNPPTRRNTDTQTHRIRRKPRPHDRLTVTSPDRSTRPRAMRRIPTRQARPTIPSTVPRLIALRAWGCKPSMRWRRLSPVRRNASATSCPSS